MKFRLDAYRILVALALAAGALWIFTEMVEEVFFERDSVLDKTILYGMRSSLDPAVPLGPPGGGRSLDILTNSPQAAVIIYSSKASVSGRDPSIRPRTSRPFSQMPTRSWTIAAK
jgi:hypothetical protein